MFVIRSSNNLFLTNLIKDKMNACGSPLGKDIYSFSLTCTSRSAFLSIEKSYEIMNGMDKTHTGFVEQDVHV